MKKDLFSQIGGLVLSFAVSISAISVFSGCTRKEETSSITVAMPDWNKLTGKEHGKAVGKNSVGTLSTIKVVSRVMINVSGPDIQNQIVYIWELGDNYQGAGAIPTPPAEYTLTVPRGPNRLIQVLAILAEIDTSSQGGGDGGAMMFYYGETLKSIANAVEPVTIALAQESTATAGDGSISGRYFFADGSTPTGPVDMYYAPIGRRPMVVESTSVFSGHFHFFLLPTVPFTFRMRNSGVPLFENVTTDSFTTRYSDRLLQIAVPSGYRDNGGGGSREFRTARTKVVGFAGPGAALVGRAVCYPTPSGPLPDLYDAATGGNQIQWSPNSSSSTDVRVLGGGIGTADGQCSAYTNVGVNSFPIYIDNLMNGDSPLGNRGPFELFDLGSGQGGSFLDVAVDNGKLAIKWKYLAEVVGNSVDGVGIFYKVFPATESMDDRWHEKAPCNQLSSFGFTEITRVPAGNPADPIDFYDWTTPNTTAMTAFNSGRLKTVVCPYANSKPGYYDFAVSHYKQSGGGGGPTATKLSVSSVTEPTVVSSLGGRQQVSGSTCTVLKIATTDSAGNVLRRANTSGSAKVSVQAPNGVKLFTNQDCTAPYGGASSVSPYLINNVAVVGVLADATVNEFDLTVTDITVGGSPLPPLTHYVTRISPLPAAQILTVVSTNIKSWQCYPIGFVRGRANGANFIGESGSTGTLFVAPVENVSYYNDYNCSSTAPPGVYLAANQSFSKRFFRYIGADPSINLTPDITEFPGLTQGSTAINVSPPAAPTRLRFEISNTLSTNDCHGFRVVAVNGQGEYSPLPTSQTVTYNFSTAPGSNDGIFSDDDCADPAGTNVSIATGMTKSATYYFRWSNPISPLTLSGTSTPLPVSPVNITVVSP
jgi:hypothetical protein